ncbi:MAG TPA: RidA family protein [bacterium]|nr:RidA family protein [bacterium]
MVGTNVGSGSPYEDPTGFSRARRIGRYIAVAGTAPIAPDGSPAHPGDLYRQTLRCLEIIEKALKDLGAERENVIRTRVYLTDAARWPEAARAHGEYFREIRPACTFVGVKGLLEPEWLVEIEADAVLED